MANKDLSQNVEINLSLNQQSVAKTRKDIESIPTDVNVSVNFIPKLIKELGLSGIANQLKVGGYSTGKNDSTMMDQKKLDQKLRKLTKSGQDYEGAFDVIMDDFINGFEGGSDKAVVSAARELNSIAQDLAKRINIQFVDNFAEAMDQTEFAIPEFDASNFKGKTRKEQIRKATEDFSVGSNGTVTVSPAMLIAAIDRLIQKNPGMEFPNRVQYRTSTRNGELTGEEAASGGNWANIRANTQINGILQDAARSNQLSQIDVTGKDRRVSSLDDVNRVIKHFFSNGTISVELASGIAGKIADILADNIYEATDKVAKAMLGGKGEKQAMRYDPMYNPAGMAGSDQQQNLLRYSQQDFVDFISELEAATGFKPGTTFANKDLYSPKYGATLGSLPSKGEGSTAIITPEELMSWQRPFNEIITSTGKFIASKKGVIEDEIISFLDGDLIDPISQFFADPRILGDITVSQAKDQKKKLESYGKMSMMQQEANPESVNAARDMSKPLEALFAKFNKLSLNDDKFLKQLAGYTSEQVANFLNSGYFKEKSVDLEGNRSSAKVFQGDKLAGEAFLALKQQQEAGRFLGANEDIYAKMESASKPFVKEMLALPAAVVKEVKAQANQTTTATAAPTADSVAPQLPNLDKYRDILGDEIVNKIVKLIGEAKGDTGRIAAAFDTEFIEANQKPIYEAGVTVKNAMGEFVDIFKMIQLPVGSAKEIDAALSGIAGAGSLQGIKGRAQTLGIPANKIGTGAGDTADMLQYRDQLVKLGTVIQALDELGISIAGNRIVDTDFRILAQSFQSVNTALSGIEGIDQIKVPAPDKINDFLKIIEILKKVPTKDLPEDLASLIQGKTDSKGKEKGDVGLGALLNKIIMMRPETVQRYGVKQSNEGFAFGDTPAHYAVADNRASLIIESFLQEFEITRKLLSQGTGILNENYSGGKFGPYSKSTVKNNPTAMGGGFGVDLAERAKAANAKVQEANAQDASNKAARDGVDIAKQQLANSKEYQAELAQLVETNKAYAAIQRILSSEDGAISNEDKILINDYIAKVEKLSDSYNKLTDKQKANKQLTGAGGDVGREAAAALEQLVALRSAPTKQNALRSAGAVKGVAEAQQLELNKKAYLAEAAVKEVADKRKAQSSKSYENTATQVERNVTGASGAATKAITSGSTERVLSIEEESRARKVASDRIKGSLKDQLEVEKQVAAANKQLINQWVTGRYALYDVGNAYQNVSRQLWQSARQIFNLTQAYRSYETAFTSVERAMQLDFRDQTGQAQALKQEFVRLSETIPVAFEELSRIATLGAQMGIAAGGIVEFTDTVAKFASITGISADTVAQKFGKIAELANIDSSDFEKLGSAVAYAGVNAVATETEILTLSESIAAVSSQAGMTAPEIIGMSTALASVGVPAEQARGVFTRVFADIDRVVATGGKSLDRFAAISGMSGESFASAWGKEGQSYNVFRSMLGGLSSAGNLTKAFDALNIVETREINTLTRLANNLNVVDQAIGDASGSFADGEFLMDSFEKTVDNLDSQITIFKNNLKSIGEELITGIAPFLGDVIEQASGFTKVLKELAKNPVPRFLAGFSIGVTVVGAGLTALTAITAKVTAQIFAFRVAMLNSVNSSNGLDTIIGRIKQLTAVSSGFIEMRDKMQGDEFGLSQRGQVEPVVFKLGDFLKGHEAKKKALLEERNIYLANGDVIALAEGKIKKASEMKKLTSDQSLIFARREAAQIDKLVQERKLEIESLKSASDAATVAGQVRTKQAETSQILYRWVGNEAVAYSQSEIAAARSVSATTLVTTSKGKETAAHILNANAIAAETRSATMAQKGILGVSRALAGIGTAVGIIGIATTLFTIVQGIITAVNEVNKIDLLESGGGSASLRDAIEKDTAAWKANKKEVEASSDFIGTASVNYKSYSKEVDKTAEAIKNLTGVNASVANSIDTVTGKVNTQTVALGKNYREWLANAIMNNPKLKEWQEKDPLALDKMMKNMADAGISFEQMIQDFIAKSQGADIDPIKPIKESITELKKEQDSLRRNATGYSPDAGQSEADWQKNKKRYEEISNQIKDLEQLKGLMESIGLSISSAFSESSMWSAIKSALGLTENAVLDLVDAYTKAKTSGKGMAAVMTQIKTAAKGLIANTDIKVNFDSANSVEEMIKLVEAAQKTELALLHLRMAASPGTSGFGNAEQALKDKYAPILNSLKALAVGAAAAVDTTGKGAETAAEKLKRLVAEANAFVGITTGLNGALRTLGASFKDSKSWSIGTEGGASKISAILGVIEQIGNKAGKNFPKAISELQVFQVVMKEMGAPASAIKYISNAINKLGGDSTLSAKQIAALKKSFPGLFKTMVAQVEAGAKPFKTLSDYVGELKNVISAAFDIRYGKEVALDAMTKAWIGMGEAAKEAQKAVKSANDEIAGLAADRTVLEYQLGVAERYKDERRAAVIRAKLAKLDGDMADRKTELASAQDAASTALTGDTKAAIDNRAKVRDLVQTYNNYLLSLANTGMSSDKLKAEAKTLSSEFLKQGTALGFAEKDLKGYLSAFEGDFTTAIDKLANNITLSVNTDPALRAIEEFVKAGNAELSGLNFDSGIGDVTPKVETPPKVTPKVTTTPQANVTSNNGSNSTSDAAKKKADKVATLKSQLKTAESVHASLLTTYGQIINKLRVLSPTFTEPGTYKQIPNPAYVTLKKQLDANTATRTGNTSTINSLKKQLKALGYANGGFISGPGTSRSDSIPAMLSNGEYVIQASSVKSYGVDFLNALNQQRVGFQPVQPSMGVQQQSGSQMVYLSPEDRALLRSAVDRPVNLYTENQKIASSANAGNVILAQRGAN